MEEEMDVMAFTVFWFEPVRQRYMLKILTEDKKH
jgi:hypothetical protein